MLQALQHIIPPELLSDEEEIYVYRVSSAHTHVHTQRHTFTHAYKHTHTDIPADCFPSDPGDGGFQGDRWTHRPEALCCGRKPGSENSHYGVSSLGHKSNSLLASRKKCHWPPMNKNKCVCVCVCVCGCMFVCLCVCGP